MEIKIKGIFLKNMVQAVKSKAGPKGLEKLRSSFGENLNFSSTQDYPVEVEIKLHKIVMGIVFGSYSAESYCQLGKLMFDIYADSIIGKTMFALLGNDLKKIALATSQVLNTVTSGLEVAVNDLDENKIEIRMTHNPYPIEYYQGIWTGAVEHFGYKPNIESNEIAPGEYNYLIEW